MEVFKFALIVMFFLFTQKIIDFQRLPLFCSLL